MKRIILLLAVLVCSIYSTDSFAQFTDWEPIESPQFVSIQFVSGVSTNDFWVLDRTGILYHYLNSSWEEFPINRYRSFSRFQHIVLPDESILLSGVDSIWQSHVYRFQKGGWEKLTVLPNTVSAIHLMQKNRIILVGDWGSVVEYSEGKFIKVNTPFKNHILVSKVVDDVLWMGVRGEGIFSFDGNNFNSYPIEGGNEIEIIGIYGDENNNITFRSSLTRSYRRAGNEFILVSRTGSSESIISNKHDFSYYKLNSENLPHSEDDITIPAYYEYKQHKQFADGSILLLCRDNALYKSGMCNNNYFLDYAMHYRIKGYEYNSNQGAAFIYYNEDSLPDLFIKSKYSELYLNKENSPFSNISEQVRIPVFNYDNIVMITDISGDGKVDIVYTDFAQSGPELFSCIQSSAGFFNDPYEVEIKDIPRHRSFRNMNIYDFDGDGYSDIDLSLYLDNELESGYQIVFLNQGYGEFNAADSALTGISRGWDVQSISADFNNDDLNDWLVIGGWKPLKLLLRQEDSPMSFKAVDVPGDTLTSFVGGLAADFNNDGFMDAAVTSDKKVFSVYLNNKQGGLEEYSDSLGLGEWNSVHYSRNINRSMNCCDINNDGFIDVFISLDDHANPRNLLFINHQGKLFVESAELYKVAKPYVSGTAAGDIDADGDIDLFGFRKGQNVLWINNKNSDNYLSVIPRGVISNADGTGCKVQLFKSGSAGDPAGLIAVRQIGSDRYGNQQNQPVAHFGLPDDGEYDIVVKFYGGRTIEKYSVAAGQTIVVSELEGSVAFLYSIPGTVSAFLRDVQNQIYIVILLLCMSVLYAGMSFGIKHFKWKSTTSLLIVMVDITIFWLLVLLTSANESNMIKYALPLVVSIGGIILPLFIFSTLKKNSFYKKSREELEEELLSELLQFTHGEWALRNISGLLLLFQNYPGSTDRESKFQELLSERASTFNKMTKPILLKIIELAEYLSICNDTVKSLSDTLSKIEKHSTSDFQESQNTAADLLLKLKEDIKEIRLSIFRFFSCNPVDAVKSISDEFASGGPDIRKYKKYESDKYALIKESDLGIILDNLFQNSVRALSGVEEPQIEIVLDWEAPKLVIEFCDNGIGIDSNNREKVFEKGYSDSKSTGKGLADCRKLLQKYNGRIVVKDTNASGGTTIRIELQEGVK